MISAKRISVVCMAASFILAACGYAATANPSPSPTPLSPTKTIPSIPTATLTLPGVPTITTTAIACDLMNSDYCVVEAFFVFQRPISPPGTDSIDRSYPYGSTEDGTRAPHHGVEFYNGSGTPVLAAANGVVYYAGNDTNQLFTPWSNFYGNLVVIQHELPGTPFGTLFTLYAHLSKVDVRVGQIVSAGQKIGEVGASGSARGSHLHFEVRINPNDYSSTLNPELWLVPHPGNGTISLLAADKTGKVISPSFNLQYYPDRTRNATASFLVNSYAPETVNSSDNWGEIAALGDQPAGWYRISFFWKAGFYERWVKIQPGKLTRMIITVK